MATPRDEDLLSRIAQGDNPTGDPDTWAALAATEPEDDEGGGRDPKLDALIDRINNLTDGETEAESPADEPGDDESADPFIPVEPDSLHEAKLTDSEVEALILKFLVARGDASGREIAEQVALPFTLISELLQQMKADQLVGHKCDAPMNDYRYQLSDIGRERGRRYLDHCTYFGTAPVSLDNYIACVTAQSMADQRPTLEALQRAFNDLLINQRMYDRLGPAVNSGRGLFLFGPPGNGKTSIAERITRAFGQYIWIPRTLGIDGEIVRLFDPVNHEEAPLKAGDGIIDKRKIDKRWVRIRRPTIIAGGELTMDALEVTINTSTNISEAPLQLKANCGTFVIDDFGRQRVSVDDLLNRWIVPLEMRYDFLNLPNGKKIKVPFDELLIFSTNLEPRDLVDEAFLRRIPYKIEAIDPTEEEFRELFRMMCDRLGFEHLEGPIDYCIRKHFHEAGRNFRCCHPRDLLLQIRNFCRFKKIPQELKEEYFDFAVENYFAVM